MVRPLLYTVCIGNLIPCFIKIYLAEIQEAMLPGWEPHNEELKSLAEVLPSLVERGRAKSTVDKYFAGWKGWLEWGKSNGLETRPAHPFYVALYLTHMFLTKGTKGSITTAMYGIRWAHHAVGIKSPTDNEMVQMTYEGCIRSCGGKKRKKDAISIEVIKRFVNVYNVKECNLTEYRFLVLSLLSFAGFFRIDELISVKLKDIKIMSEHMEIFLPRAKNDQHRDGETVYIARTGSKYCPVWHVEDFLKKAGLEPIEDQTAYLIPTLHKTKKGHKASKSRGISYTRAYEIFHENLKKLNINGAEYGLHSFRSGGASAAADNGVSDRLISKHGRWSSDSARNSYIKDNKKKRLSVSSSLGL